MTDVSHGLHELLDRAYPATEFVGEHLLDHHLIEHKPEWKELAEKAHQALFDLYQAIGQEHL